ncbi:hypothetical protein [Rubrivirga marina]|uniref:Uncharacterized protein n=1 Tax=Rubrivirga marina TaxID=1196024 RepID=A0A271J0S6_9BACT|nr:hypothetical protein [Rubrivirga marina]PAP77102.1 hypothetical protein BSZ37_12030 [Rubrivirga marina]
MSDPPASGRRALRTAALYVVLVGVPALGVAATIHVGQNLEAPPSVGGAWAVAPDAEGCARAAGALVVEQSGPQIEAVYTPEGASAVALRGRVADTAAVLGERASCERVEVAVARDPSRPATLRATLQTGVCGCRTTSATLTRADAAPLAGGH